MIVIPVQFFLGVIYLQWLFWVWLLNSDYELNNEDIYNLIKYVFLFLFMIFFYASYTDFHIDAIKPYHLCVYSVLLWICYMMLDESSLFSYKEVICLSFLIVFINSEYWESPLRFFAVLNHGVDRNDILQLTHFIPFIILNYIYNYKRKSYKILVKGLIFLFILSILRLFLLTKITPDYDYLYMFIQRIGALYFLTRFYIISKENENVDFS